MQRRIAKGIGDPGLDRLRSLKHVELPAQRGIAEQRAQRFEIARLVGAQEGDHARTLGTRCDAVKPLRALTLKEAAV